MANKMLLWLKCIQSISEYCKSSAKWYQKKDNFFFIPSVGSNPNIGSTSTTNRTLASRKRKLTTIVWNDFEKFIVDGQDYAICKYYKSRLKANGKNETKHLHIHIDRCIKQRMLILINNY